MNTELYMSGFHDLHGKENFIFGMQFNCWSDGRGTARVHDDEINARRGNYLLLCLY